MFKKRDISHMFIKSVTIICSKYLIQFSVTAAKNKLRFSGSVFAHVKFEKS